MVGFSVVNEFTVGDSVRTTVDWNLSWIGPGYVGTVEKIDLNGGPMNKARTVLVQLDKTIGPFQKVWFDPKDLELND